MKWNNNPERIHEHIVSPEINLLRAAVHDVINKLSKGASGIVQDIAIELAKADNHLQRVAERVVQNNAVGAQERQGSPEDGGDGFHADDE